MQSGTHPPTCRGEEEGKDTKGKECLLYLQVSALSIFASMVVQKWRC